MKKSDIFNIFIAGVEYGQNYGPFPGLDEVLPEGQKSIFELHQNLTTAYNSNVQSVTWTVIIAGFNYGVGLRDEKPTEEEKLQVFENLIGGKRLKPEDAGYYAIKEKIDELLKSN